MGASATTCSTLRSEGVLTDKSTHLSFLVGMKKKNKSNICLSIGCFSHIHLRAIHIQQVKATDQGRKKRGGGR